LSDKAFAVSTILFITWITLWMLAYDNIWLKIPFIKDMFPLPLPNGNLSYSDFVTSVGIMGTLLLGLMVGYYASKIGKETVGRFGH
jgi:hypothetical protein